MKFSILDLLFPKYCSGCRKLGSYICLACQKELRYVDPDVCMACGKASYAGVTHTFCVSPVDAFGAVVVYRGIVTRVIKDSKYRLAGDVLVDFLTLIEPMLFGKVRMLMTLSSEAEILPIPLHPKRYRERGFNQSEIIAKRVAKLTGKQVGVCLRRVRHNPPQAHLPHNAVRAENVKGIFEVVKGTEAVGRDFLLVDDVVTTGSTVAEAAATLKAAGARRIMAIALAKG